MTNRMGMALLFVCLTVACGSTKGEKKRADEATSARVDLALIARDVVTETQHIARRVTNENKDRNLRRVMVKWQANTLDYCQRAMQRPDPRLAFVDIWTLVVRTKAYVQGEEGHKLLGDCWSIVDDGLATMNRRLKRRAQALIPAKHLAEMEAAVNAYVARLAVDGADMTDPSSVRSTDDGIMSVIMSVPQGVFSLGGGVKDTAVSVTEVAQAARQGVEVMSSLPIRARWQTEMLLFSIEENEVVVRLLDDVSRASAATAKVGNTVESLPEKLEQTTIRQASRRTGSGSRARPAARRRRARRGRGRSSSSTFSPARRTPSRRRPKSRSTSRTSSPPQSTRQRRPKVFVLRSRICAPSSRAMRPVATSPRSRRRLPPPSTASRDPPSS
ncbi:MAG: hypothetical protein ACYS0E_21175 [Planctomycetota bacterium]